MHNIIIRDGGSTTDADALPTILTAISYSYTGTANTIRAAALFTTSGSKVADATTVGANSIIFTGLSGSDVTTNDNNAGGAKELILRVTFNSTVTDNQKLVFTVTSVTGGAVCSYSQFAAADGGGAFSDNTTDDDNRIEVVADRIVFGTQPASTSVNTNLSAFTIRFQDVNGNLDFDNNRTVTLTATDGGVNMSASASYSITAPHSGIVAFSDVQFTSAPQTAITITANTTGLLTTNTVKSNPFDIFDIPVGSYRTTTDGVWSSSPANNTITWQELKSTGWETMALPSSTYPSTTTTNKVYIFNNVTLNGTNTAKNIIVESTGTLSTSTVTPTFKNLLIKTGGVFNKNPGNGLKFDTDGILEVENGGTFNYSHTNATSRSTNLWAGTEKFHPKSNFVVKETDNSVGSGNQVVESASDVSLFNGAMFGNFIVDMGTGGGKVPLFVSGLNTKLTNGDFILRTGSDNGMIFNNGNYTVTIGGDLIVESTYIQPFTLTNSASTVNFTVNGDVVHNGTAEFRLANSQTTNNPSVTLNIDSNLVIGSSNFIFDIGSSSTGTNKSVVNLKGDLTVGSGNILTQNTSAAKKGEFNFTGTYNDADVTTIQTVDVASTGATTENARIDFNVKSGAYTQLINRDFELGTNSKLTVETGSIFDFGFNGTTALNVGIANSMLGTAFESKQNATLKISSPDGLYGNWNTTVFPSVTQAIGNLRLPKSNRTIDNEATFWYIGKVNQQTGDAPNANNTAGTYSTTANGKVVICDLASNSISLTPSVSFGVAQSTAVSTTGGKLDIRKGQFIETEDQFIFGSTGTLYMAPSTLYKIVHGSATDPSGAGDDIPRMDGSGFPYVLTGGTIELGGTGSDHQYQRLRSDNAFYNYKYVKFSGNNTSGTFKNLNQTTTIDSALIITGSPIVDCFTGGTGSAASFVGNGGLIMDGGLLRIRKRTDTNPELEGINADYNLTGGTIEFYGTAGAGNRQQIRGNYGSPAKLVEYNNIEINADEARLPSTVTGNVDLTSSFTLKGTMNVNAPAILNMDSNDFIYKFSGNTTNNVNIKSGAGLTYGSPFGITTVAAGGTGIDPTVSPGGANPAAGNIRTNIRTFDANASYGFVSPGNMVSGSGLPATVKSLYVLKSNTTDRVTLTNTVRADSALRMFRGHIITGTNRVELGKDVTNRGTLDYTDGCYVVGNMRRWYDGTNTGDASGLYPLGEDKSGTIKNRKYLIEYSAYPTGGYLDVNFNPVNMGLSGIPIMGIPAVGTCTSPFDVTTTEDEGYWIATPESGKLGDGAYKLSITGEDFSTITDLCQLTLLKRVGAGNWTAPGTHLQPSGTINVPTVSRSDISGFSNFGFGGGAPNPLPVELTSFTASCKDDNMVEVRWTTATEFNSSYFILERSLDAARFETVAYVPAAVNSSTVRNYSVLDTGTVSNSNYYRLTEVDQSGKRTMYSLVYVRCREVNGWNAYHTPDGIVVEATTNSTKDIQIRLYEVSGKLLMQEKQVAQRGYNRYNMQMPALAKGVYIIQLLSGDDMESVKVWVP
ncbi:MAG TPA: T9SS type A sorting domain-containing protein [Chitinophagales bacterium]|nr:T9SS type A sorting domain-containing protein [Chitinophagales bacterium]